MANLNVGNSTQVRGSTVRGPEAQPATPQTAPTNTPGTTPADTVDRSGTSNRPSGEGATASTGTGEQLGALHAAAGTQAPGAQVAALGDVDLHVVANAQLHNEGLFSGVENLVKEGALATLSGLGAALKSEQKKKSKHLFGNQYKQIHVQMKEFTKDLRFNILNFVNFPKLSKANERSLEDLILPRAGVDVNALVQWLMRECYMDNIEDLRMYAEKVQYYNECKKLLREETKRTREAAITVAGGEDNAPVNFQPDASVMQNGEYYGQSLGRTDGRQEATRASEEPVVEAPPPPAEPKVEHRGTKTERVYKDHMVNGNDGDENYNRIREDYDQLAQNTIADLPTDPAARAKLEAEFKQHPFTTQGTVVDIDGDNNTYTWPGGQADADRMQDGETLEDYIQRRCTDDANNFVHDIRDTRDEGEIEIESVTVTADLTRYVVENPDGLGATAGAQTATPGYQEGQPIHNKKGLDEYIKILEDKLNTIGDDAQMANVDLQNMMQKQQQLIQAMSNLSKQLHDNAMAVIRKIGG